MRLFKDRNMSIEQKMDYVLEKLYDKNFLHTNKVNVKEILNDTKASLDETETLLALEFLKDGGYVKMHTSIQGSSPTPSLSSYSLTPKAIMFKRKGGFVRDKLISRCSQFLILFGGFIALVSALFTVVDLGIKYFTKNLTPTPVVTKIVTENHTTNYCNNCGQDTSKHHSVKQKKR